MFNAYRALKLTGAAGRALEDGLLGVVFAQKGFGGGWAKVVEVIAQSKDDFFGVEQFAGVGSRAVLGASTALDAGVGLEADQPGEVRAGHQAKVFVPGQRRNLGEAAVGEKDGSRAEKQVQVLGVRNEREKNEQGQRVKPPQDAG